MEQNAPTAAASPVDPHIPTHTVAPESGPETTLTYIDGRGRAEHIRLVLFAAGIQYKENFIKSKEELLFFKKTGVSIFGQVPLLQIQGEYVSQSSAIIRYIARRYHLYGENLKDETQCDMLFDGIMDSSDFLDYPFKEDKEAWKMNNIRPKIDRYYPIFESLLSKNQQGKGFLVGKTLTFVDLVLLLELESLCEVFGEKEIERFPNLSGLRNRLKAMPNVGAFFTSPHRKPQSGEAYVSLVLSIFG